MRHRVKEHTRIEIDIENDLIFLNAENVLDKNTLEMYETKIKNNFNVDPIEVFKTKYRDTLLKELRVKKLNSLIREAKFGEWIYIVTDGNHRATAFVNKKKNIPAYLIWVDK